MFDGKNNSSDVFANYLRYTEATEPPVLYHRWCYLTALSAAIGRKAHIDHGHFRVFSNLYVMLLGEPAARKSTSIKMVKKLLASAGYEFFAADKTTKEKFLLDLEGVTEDVEGEDTKKKYDLVTADNLWGKTDDNEPREMFVVADEFNDFAGPGNLDFFTTLGNLWDFDSPTNPFTQRLKNSRSVSIYQPTISILSGNTPELFARAFPPEAIGSGFLSRLLLIHGERSGRKITFPPPPDPELGASLTSFLRKLLTTNPGTLTKSEKAYKMLDDIYQNEDDIMVADIRFKAYNNRRFTQLLKLCVILATAKFQSEVNDEDVLQANTILSHAELLMPKAMGEFGRSKNSSVANKIMDVVERATKPVTTKEIWAQVRQDLTTMKDLIDLLNGLITADKLQSVGGHSNGAGFLPKKVPAKQPRYVDWQFLTSEEREMI